jgi:hypothetical protein
MEPIKYLCGYMTYDLIIKQKDEKNMAENLNHFDIRKSGIIYILFFKCLFQDI